MSIYLPKRKGGRSKTAYYHFDFVLKPVGRTRSQRFCGSTGQKTKARAQRVEDRLRELAALGQLSNLMTVAAACERYLDEKAPEAPERIPGEIEPMHVLAKRRARQQQEHCMSQLVAFYGAETPLVSITPDTVLQAVALRKRTPLRKTRRVGGELIEVDREAYPTTSTINRQVVEPMRRLLRRAKKFWGVPVDLEQFSWGGADGLKLDEPKERNRALSAAEELLFWERLDADYHLICEMYIISGKRQSLWILCPKVNIDRDGGRVYMRKLKKRREEWHWVDLTERELEIVDAAWDEARDCPYLFTAKSRRNTKSSERHPITAQMLKVAVKRAIEAAGIQDFHPHDFRHTFGTRAAQAAGGNIKVVQTAMDHGSLESTMRYIQVLPGEVRALRSRVSVTKTLPKNVAMMRRRENK